MADLIDTEEANDPIDKPLRLSIRWLGIGEHVCEGDIEAILQIGLFLGDEPLFADAAYDHPPGYRETWLLPGYFSGESIDCQLLDDLWALLSTGKRMDFDDVVEPTFRLAIAPLPFLLWYDREPDPDREPDYYEVLTIIRHGGPWHGDAMGGAGPAAYFVVDRPELVKFFYDLLDEALDPKVSDEAARRTLKERFGEAIGRRSLGGP